jgi:hypothetical protein
MGENEQAAQDRGLLLVKVAAWAFCLGAAAGFGICWKFFTGASTPANKPVAVAGSTEQPQPADRPQAFRPTYRQASPPSATVRVTPPAPEVPGQMTEYRNRVGESILFKVTGATGGATIWGTNVYTDDSPLPITAVHFGALKSGEEGIIRVTILPGQNSYEGSTQNGVSSSNYAKWHGSYGLERVTGPVNEPVLELPAIPPSQQAAPQLFDGLTPATGPAGR